MPVLEPTAHQANQQWQDTSVMTGLLLILQPLPPLNFSFICHVTSIFRIQSIAFCVNFKVKGGQRQVNGPPGPGLRATWNNKAHPHQVQVSWIRYVFPHWIFSVLGATWATVLRVMTQRGKKEQNFPGQTSRRCLGLFPDKVTRRHSPSGFNKNNIPPSGVIQNVKYRQDLMGGKKRLVW